ncbi:DUF481 domain-containing protein [Opitutaceae bacterium]|nr:DUF481 domain-containing protein [Opitutaceae bacterium]
MNTFPRFIRNAMGITIALFTTSAWADEIRMPNGEVLTGKVISQTEQTIVFDSDSFGRLELPNTPAINVTQSGAPTKPPTSTDSVNQAAANVSTTKEGGPEESAKPSWLNEISKNPDRWSYDLKIGLDFLQGEVELDSYTLETTLGYKIAPHEFGLFAAYQETKLFDTDLARSTEYIGRYFYREDDAKWMLITQADWLRDRINLTEYRFNALGIPAYRFIDKEDQRFLLGVGPSYREEARLVDNGGTDLDEVEHSSFRIAAYQVFQYDLPPRWRFRETLLIQIDPDSSDNIGIRFDTMLSYDLTEHLSLNLKYEVVEDTNEAFIDQTIRTLNLMIGYNF